MSWSVGTFFDSVAKRFCKSLLNHFLGPYLDVPLSDAQINFDSNQRQAVCESLSLNAEKINCYLQAAEVPLIICVAYIDKIVVNNPWKQGGSGSGDKAGCSTIEIYGLEIECKPSKQGHMPPTDDMLQSMVASMVSSIPDKMEQSIIDSVQPANVSPCDEDILAKLTNIVISSLSTTSLSLYNTLLRLEHCPRGATRGMGLQLLIGSLQIASSSDTTTETDLSVNCPLGEDAPQKPHPTSTASSSGPSFLSLTHIVKQVQITDVVLNWDVFTVSALEMQHQQMESATLTDSMTESQFMDGVSVSSMSHRQLAKHGGVSLGSLPPADMVPETSDMVTVPLLVVPGTSTAQIQIRTTSSQTKDRRGPVSVMSVSPTSEPRLQLTANLSTVHVLLTPDEVHWLLHLCTELSSTGSPSPHLSGSNKTKLSNKDPYRGNVPLHPDELRQYAADTRGPNAPAASDTTDSVYFKSCISCNFEDSSQVLQSEMFLSAMPPPAEYVVDYQEGNSNMNLLLDEDKSTLASLREAAADRFGGVVQPAPSGSVRVNRFPCTHQTQECLANVQLSVDFFSLVLLHRQPRAARSDPCSDLIRQQEQLLEGGGSTRGDSAPNVALVQARADSEELCKLAERHFSLLRQVKTRPDEYGEQLSARTTSSSRLHFMRLVRANLVEVCEMDHLSVLIHGVSMTARHVSSGRKMSHFRDLTMDIPLVSEVLYLKNTVQGLSGLLADLCNQRPVEIHEILSFPESGSCLDANPCLQVHMQSHKPFNRDSGGRQSVGVPVGMTADGDESEFQLRCTVASCELQLDVTLVDRLQHTLSYGYICRHADNATTTDVRTRLQPTSSGAHLTTFQESGCTSPFPRSSSMMDSMYVDLNSPGDSHEVPQYMFGGHHGTAPSTGNLVSQSAMGVGVRRSTTSLYLSCPGCVKVHVFVPLPRATTNNSYQPNQSTATGSTTTGQTGASATAAIVPGCSTKSPCTWKRHVFSDWFRVDFSKPALCSTFSSTDVKTTLELSAEQVLICLCQSQQVEPVKLVLALSNTESPVVLLPSVTIVLQPATTRMESVVAEEQSSRSHLFSLAAGSSSSWERGNKHTTAETSSRPSPLRWEQSYSHNSALGHHGEEKSYYRPSDAEEMARYHNSARELTEVAVHIQVPYLLVQLQEKELLDRVYERLACELPLWKPAIFSLEHSLLPLNPPWFLGTYPPHCILHHEELFVICPWANLSVEPHMSHPTQVPHVSPHSGTAEFQDFPNTFDDLDGGLFTIDGEASRRFENDLESDDEEEEDEDDLMDDEEDYLEDDDIIVGGSRRRARQNTGNPTAGAPVLRSSNFCITVSVDHGYISAHVPLTPGNKKQTEECSPMDMSQFSFSAPPFSKRNGEVRVGKLHFRLKQAFVFFESGHNGDPNLAFITVHLHRASIYHKGSMVARTLTDLDQPQSIIAKPPNDVLLTLLPLPGGIQPTFAQPVTGQEMLTVAIQIRDFIPSSPTGKQPGGGAKQSKKHNQRGKQATGHNNTTTASSTAPTGSNRPHQDLVVAVTIQEAFILYRVARSEEFWIKQLLDWFTFPQVELPGYTAPTAATKLCISFLNIAADYSCSELAYCGLLTCESVTLATHILSESQTSVLEIALQGLGFCVAESTTCKSVTPRSKPGGNVASVPLSSSFSKQIPRGSAPAASFSLHEALLRNVRTHYVPVLDLTQLDMTVAANPLHIKTCPLVDIRCTNQSLTFHSCADSCLAVIRILRHIASRVEAVNNTPTPGTDNLGSTRLSSASSTSLHQQSGSRNSSEANFFPVTEMAALAPGEEKPDVRHEEFHNMIQDALFEPLRKMHKREGQQEVEEDEEVEEEVENVEESNAPWNDFEVIPDESIASIEDSVHCLLVNPVTRKLDPGERLTFMEEHFAPVNSLQRRKNPFCEPSRYPQPQLAVTLHDVTLVWKLFGGCDFAKTAIQSKQPQSGLTRTSSVAVPIPSVQSCSDTASGLPPSGTTRTGTTGPPQGVMRFSRNREIAPTPPPLGPQGGMQLGSVGLSDVRPSSSWDRDRSGMLNRGLPNIVLYHNQPMDNASLRSVNSEVSLLSMSHPVSTVPVSHQSRSPLATTSSTMEMSTRSTTTNNSSKTAAQRKQEWWRRGGRGRDHDKAVEVRISKLHFRFAHFSPKSRFFQRFVLILPRLEILDQVKTSQYEKLLYQHCLDNAPYDMNAPMFRMKVLLRRAGVFHRVDNSEASGNDESLEMEVKASMQPLRIHVDQDTVEVLEQYFHHLVEEVKVSDQTQGRESSYSGGVGVTEYPTGVSRHSSVVGPASRPSSSCSRESLVARTTHSQDAVLSVDLIRQETSDGSGACPPTDSGQSPRPTTSGRDPSGIMFHVQSTPAFDELSPKMEQQGERKNRPTTLEEGFSLEGGSSESANSSLLLQPHTSSFNAMEASPPPAAKPIYIRRFSFSPDVPILLDYHGKRLDMTQGALTGLLKCLAEFNKSSLTIHRLHYERGLKDMNRLLEVIAEDLQADLCRQWPGLLSGLGPMHEVLQIASGFRDLIWMPVESYREDGSVLRGIKKGTRSFSACAVTSSLELLWRGLSLLHNISEVSYDLVTPGPSLRSRRPRLRQPADLREGCSNAAATVTRGLTNLKDDFAEALASGRHSGKGAAGTAGEILRHIPPAVIAPLAVGTEATGYIIGGLRNQIRPNAQTEDRFKYKPRQLQ